MAKLWKIKRVRMTDVASNASSPNEVWVTDRRTDTLAYRANKFRNVKNIQKYHVGDYMIFVMLRDL